MTKLAQKKAMHMAAVQRATVRSALKRCILDKASDLTACVLQNIGKQAEHVNPATRDAWLLRTHRSGKRAVAAYQAAQRKRR